MADDLLLTDMTCALPASGWTDADSTARMPFSAPPPGKWRILDYQSDHYHGRALQTSCPDATVLRIPLNRRGWHAVSIGISERGWGQSAIDVRLSGDAYWQHLRAIDGSGEGPLHEEPWTFADLTGRDLEVRYPSRTWGNPVVAARVFSVRARPVAPEDLPIVQGSRHARLVYFNDGIGIFCSDEGDGSGQSAQERRNSAEIVPRAVGGFAGGDWDVCSFACGGADLVNYPSRVGTLFCEGGWDFAYANVREIQGHLQSLIAAGIDPLRQAIEQAHAQGHLLWMYQRPQAWTADPQLGHYALSRFYAAHPEWRCIEADGRPIWALSIAFDGVRKQLNAILREALERGADGITLLLTRGFPLVRYEEPVRARFRERHGDDARAVPEDDARLRGVWSEFVIDWLREIRRLLDGAGASPLAKRRTLSVMVGATRAWNLHWGFDVAAWAREGLVDSILPFPKGVERANDIRIEEFVEDLAGSRVELLPCLASNMDRYISFAKFRQRAHRYYRAGATGLSCWDTHNYLARLRLDDAELQRLWCERYMGPQNIDITSIGGIPITGDFGPLLAF